MRPDDLAALAVRAALDTVPGIDDALAATINRFGASSVQTMRMAVHAIRAGQARSSSPAGSSA
ncbi:hypothetical protein QK900_04375 [Arsenicicoccus dermatophilus]|nr:hypothetical protein [Arsenicicoccus dermatophilus]MCH8612148.1 hypothetical protein [Arsenicicoccus dermatophilus]